MAANRRSSDAYRRSVDCYVDDVIAGKLPSCHQVRLAVDRWMSDLNRDDLFFDASAFTKFCRFSSALRHYKGEFAGRRVELMPWQLFIAANLFGLKKKATKTRKYQYADVYVPRKNGKTTFAAIIALYMLLFDGESAAEVYAAAVDKEQAKICFDTAKQLILNSSLADLVEVYRFSVVEPATASSFKPLTKDTKNKDGLNPSAAICDERHAWRTNEIYDVIKTGIGARRQPLVFSISTAGTDTSYPYFADLEFLRQVLNGQQQKDNHFVMIFEPDEGDDWKDERVWRKVNPNYGVSLYEDYMMSEYAEARSKGGSTQSAFMTKNLNIWVDAPEVWISDEDVAACSHGTEERELIGHRCYVGIDLASKIDITAVAFYFPDDNAATFRFIVPEEKIKEKGDRVDYELWRQQGYIVPTPGKILDQDWFVTYAINEFEKYEIVKIAYDPWNMWDILGKFGKYSENLVEYQQSIRYMSVPTKRLEGDVVTHKIDLLCNPVIRWMFRNVVIYKDPNGNIKLDKTRSRNKIDGVVALVDAIGGYLTDNQDENPNPYESHGLRTINF